MKVRDEIIVRHRYTDDVIAFFLARPNVWIEARELARVGGFCAWRTRISEARKQFRELGGDVEWNGQVRSSAYRYRPFVAIGRSAETVVSGQGDLFVR